MLKVHHESPQSHAKTQEGMTDTGSKKIVSWVCLSLNIFRVEIGSDYGTGPKLLCQFCLCVCVPK